MSVAEINRQVFAWHEHDRDSEDHDIQSFRFGPGGKLQPLRLEVKSSKADDLGTVRVSERQLQCAREAGPGGYQHKFVLVQTGPDRMPIERTVEYVDLAALEPHLLPVEWRLDGTRWKRARRK